MEATRPVSSSMSDYLAMLRRHWWIVVLAAGLGTGAAAGYTAHQPKVYQSRTSVLVHPTGSTSDTNVVGGRTRGDINLDTEAQLVRSTAVATEAAKLLRVDTLPDALARQVTVEVPANTSVLVVSFAAGTPRDAQAGSHAFAEAYLRNREGSAKADLAGQIASLDAKIKQLNTSVAQINGRLPGMARDSAERENLESQRDTARSQINTLAGRLNQLTTATISPGKVISDARLPRRPAKPSVPLNLGTGGMVGLLAGLGIAFVRERLDRRVRTARELPRRFDLPVLAVLPNRAATLTDDVFPPYGTGGRTFNRLRNEILASLSSPTASLAPGSASLARPLAGVAPAGAATVVVTGASRGAGAAVVAANLAAALARTGSEVVLVCARTPDTLAETASVARMLGVGALPGLSDVLAGRVGLADALQRAPRTPWLRVITTGGTASAAGLLQSQALRDMLGTVKSRCAYVVIEAPSTAVSADAQSLARLADAAIVTVELRRTGQAEVADAIEQLHRIGTPLLGAVVLPRLASSRAGHPRPTGDTRPVANPRPTGGDDRGENVHRAGEVARTDNAVPEPRTNGDHPHIDEVATLSFTQLDPATLEALDRARSLDRARGRNSAPGRDQATGAEPGP